MKAEGGKKEKKKSGEDGVKQLPIDQSFCEVVLFCTETNLWGVGPVLPCKPGPFLKRRQGGQKHFLPEQECPANDILQDEHSLHSLSGKVLNKDILFSISTGNDRMKNYFETFLKIGDWFDPSCSETDVPLTKINPEVADVKEDAMMKDISCMSLVDYKCIDEAYTKDELKDELFFLMDC